MSSTRVFGGFSLLAFSALVGLAGCGAEGPATESEAHEHVGHAEQAWDSQAGNPTHATHSYLTEYAVDQLSGQYPELATYRATLVDGANRELHELPVSDPFEEELRVAVGGTNWGADHPEVAWHRAKASYAAGDKGMAYWYVGVVLHYVEDMGVPAHAFHVIHQGNLTQRDNFELLGLQRWAPLFDSLHTDPHYAAPSDYVAWSGAWTKSDFQQAFPGTTYSLHMFPVSWLWSSNAQATFVREREGHTAVAAKLALHAAAISLPLKLLRLFERPRQEVVVLDLGAREPARAHQMQQRRRADLVDEQLP